MKDIVIFGAGGSAREILQVIHAINAASQAFRFRGFLVDAAFRQSDFVHGFPVLGDLNWLEANPNVLVSLSVGDSFQRMKCHERVASAYRNSFATLIHPNAWIGENVEIGEGVVICSHSSITTDIKIGAHVHVNLNCTIGHGSVIDDFVTINAGVSVAGDVIVNKGVTLGTGSVVIPRVEIGKWSIIGAGAVVTRSLAGCCTAVGVPAVVIKSFKVAD